MKHTSTIYKLGIVLTCALSINLLVALKSSQQYKQDAQESSQNSLNATQKPSSSTSSFSTRRHVLKKGNWG